MSIDHVLFSIGTESDFFSIFNETADKIHDWCIATEIRVEDLIIRASKTYDEIEFST